MKCFHQVISEQKQLKNVLLLRHKLFMTGTLAHVSANYKIQCIAFVCMGITTTLYFYNNKTLKFWLITRKINCSRGVILYCFFQNFLLNMSNIRSMHSYGNEVQWCAIKWKQVFSIELFKERNFHFKNFSTICEKTVHILHLWIFIY